MTTQEFVNSKHWSVLGFGLVIAVVFLFLIMFGPSFNKEIERRNEPYVRTIKDALAGEPIKLHDLTYAIEQLRRGQEFQRQMKKEIHMDEILKIMNEDIIVQVKKQ